MSYFDDPFEAMFQNGKTASNSRTPQLDMYEGREEDYFKNAPHRSPRMVEIERELRLRNREVPLNISREFYIDLKNKPENDDYAWVQYWNQGIGFCDENIEAYQDGDWDLVKRITHPELCKVDPRKRTEFRSLRDQAMGEKGMVNDHTRSDEFIKRKGMVLMKKNARVNQMAKDRIANVARDTYNSYDPQNFNSRPQKYDMRHTITVPRDEFSSITS